MPDSRTASRIGKIGLAIVFGYSFIYHFHHQIRGEGLHINDFSTFYLAAEFARQHRDIYTAGINPDLIYVYPPLIAVVCTPLTFLSMAHAAQVALLLNTLMLLGSIVLATRSILSRFNADVTRLLWPVTFLVSILSFNQMRSVLTMGETDALMLFMFALALYWLDSKPALCGTALALALNVKYLSIVMLPYLILRRRWKAAIAMVLGTIFFALAPAVLLGWHEDLRCLRVSCGGLLRWVGVPPEKSHAIRVHNIADGLSISITSALARAGAPLGLSNPVVMVLAAALGCVTLGFVARMYRAYGFPVWRWPDRPSQDQPPFRGLVALDWTGLVTAALVFSPNTNTRHLVLAVIVDALAASLLFLPRRRVNRTPALVGAMLISVAFIMPFGRESTFMRAFYYTWSIPGWGLLLGFLLALWTALQYVAEESPL